MKKNGFTLIELLVYMVVGLIIMYALYDAAEMGMRSSASTGRRVLTTQDARLVLDFMAVDIRSASYNRWHAVNIWRGADANGNPIAAAGVVVPLGGLRGIQFANASTILVQMDLNENSQITLTPNDPNEVIRYSYDGVDTITRSSNGGPNQAILGGAGFGTLVRNAQAGVPLFQYFDSNGILLDPAQLTTLAVNQRIRRIRITIVADTEGIDPLTGVNKRMTHTTDLLVKNHPLAGIE